MNTEVYCELTAENVENIFLKCLFKEGEPTDGYVLGEGVMTKCGFHPLRLENHKDVIQQLLLQLPDEFLEDKGGGMSFLRACDTKSGTQWGEHRNIDQLVMLGMAIKHVKWCLPRELWSSLPGGMPYFSINV